MSVLSPTEFRLLLVVNERTLRYNKEEEIIPIRHFTDGVYSKDGTVITNPIPANRATIVRAYKSLIEKNILIVKKHQRRHSEVNKFAINFNFLLTRALEMAKLKLPKPRKESKGECARGTVGGALEVQGGVRQEYTISTDRVEALVTTKEQTGRGPGLLEVVNSAYDKYKAKVSAKADKVNVSFTQPNVEKAWANAIKLHEGADAFSHVNQRDFYALRSGYAAYKLPIAFTDFVDWAVSQWQDLKGNEMRWCESMPALPSFKFFAYFYRHFVSVYADQQKRKELEAKKKHKVVNELRDTTEELNKAKQDLQTLANKLRGAELSTAHYQRLLREKAAAKPAVGPLKNHSDLKFDEIDPI